MTYNSMIRAREIYGDPVLSVNERRCATVMVYLDSKADIGIIESADIMNINDDDVDLRIEGITKKIWHRVIYPELQKLIEIIGVQFGEDMHRNRHHKRSYPESMKKRHDYINIKVRA